MSEDGAEPPDKEEFTTTLPTVPPGYWLCMGTDDDGDRCEGIVKNKIKNCPTCNSSSK